MYVLKLSSWPHEKAEKSALKHVEIVIAGSNPALKNLKSSFVCQLHGLFANLLEICAESILKSDVSIAEIHVFQGCHHSFYIPKVAVTVFRDQVVPKLLCPICYCDTFFS